MKKLISIISIVIGILIILSFFIKMAKPLGFATRGFTTLQSTRTTDAEYHFGVIDMPTERVGAASSSTGFEFGKMQLTSATAFTVATTSVGFAVTIQQSGIIKGCTFELNAQPTTGTVAIMIQKNGSMVSGKYCKLPNTGTFATNGALRDTSTEDTVLDQNITVVSGDRIGLIASTSGLNAATIDGKANLIIQLDN